MASTISGLLLAELTENRNRKTITIVGMEKPLPE
jgi:hypothetical protein